MESGNLKILYAYYGIDKNWLDVKNILGNLKNIRNNNLNISINNELFGKDPNFGFKKILKIKYKIQGKEYSKIINEDEILNIITPLYKLCLVAIFKNESHILDEWLNHYINEGVEHFFLIDNGSDDNYKEIINKYENITLVIDNKKYSQIEHYNNYYLDKCKKYEWIILCDLDEFIYARNGFNKIDKYLDTVDNNISQIYIPWKIFGSSGYNILEKKQPKNVIKNFTKRLNYDKMENTEGIIRKKKYKLFTW